MKLDYQFSQYTHDKNNNRTMERLLEEADYPGPSGTAHDGDISVIS